MVETLFHVPLNMQIYQAKYDEDSPIYCASDAGCHTAFLQRNFNGK
jgi:hypothetical protein